MIRRASVKRSFMKPFCYTERDHYHRSHGATSRRKTDQLEPSSRKNEQLIFAVETVEEDFEAGGEFVKYEDVSQKSCPHYHPTDQDPDDV